MSKREDIIDHGRLYFGKKPSYGLVYSEVLGWLDLGHAQGKDIERLYGLFQVGEQSSKPYYTVKYVQEMVAFKRLVRTGRYTVWHVKKGRSLHEIRSIALAMMMETAYAFESWQAMPFFSWYTDSGFSAEDMTSDLLGYYMKTFNRTYWDELRIAPMESALRRWDYYGKIGNYKNSGFLPLLFPDPGIVCPRQPYKGKLPYFMTLIQPYKVRVGDDTVIREHSCTVPIGAKIGTSSI